MTRSGSAWSGRAPSSGPANLVDVKITGVDELGNQMQARLEAADKTIADPDLRWRPVGDPVRLVPDGSGRRHGVVRAPST